MLSTFRTLAVLCVVSLFNAAIAAELPLSGDKEKAQQVWNTFDAWLTAYSQADLPAVMRIFDPDIQFSFQGVPDQTYANMRAAYEKDFASRNSHQRWVPTLEEIHADQHMAIVRAIWELQVDDGSGKAVTRSRNRSMDVFRLGDDGRWVIFRSINYPETK